MLFHKIHKHRHHSIKNNQHSFNHGQDTKKTIIISLVLVSIFMVTELAGGLLSKSLALVADSLHMLTDVISLILALLGVIISQKSRNSKKTYGYSRFEIIMSLINSLFLVFICIYITIEAFIRMYNQQVINTKVMLPIACLGLIVNFATMFLFYMNNKSKGNNKSLLVQSVFLHFLSDACGSIIAIVAGLLMYYKHWYIADPILSFVLVLLILRSAIMVILSSINILMESPPSTFTGEDIEKAIENNIKDVIDVHHVHLWMLNEHDNLTTLHVVINKNADIMKVLKDTKTLLLNDFNIKHATIQLEEKCLDIPLEY